MIATERLYPIRRPLAAMLAGAAVAGRDADRVTRHVQGVPADASSLSLEAQGHAMWAADVWYSIKKHWCLEAQSLIRARRTALGRP